MIRDTRRCSFGTGTAILLSIAVALILVISSGIGGIYSNSYSAISSKSNASVTVSAPIYIWFFGYVGNVFYPKVQLGLTINDMLAAAKQLSNTFGRQNLVFLTSVDEVQLPNNTINKSMVPQIANYVADLHKYAAAVYGRLDLYQFNLTESPGYGSCSLGGGIGPWQNCPIYNQSSLYLLPSNEGGLGLDGVWFDHASQYYDNSSATLCKTNHICGVGPAEFNQMMQNLTTMFPNAVFILNQTPGTDIGYVQEGVNDCGGPSTGGSGQCTWSSNSYVAPSPGQKSRDLNMSMQVLQTENSYFPGHVIVHLDAEGPAPIGINPKEPMSIFADETQTVETENMQNLYYNSTHPALPNETYAMVMPFVGSWTCDCDAYHTSGPNYGGTLYNALSEGNFPRSMVKNLENIIKNNEPPAITISSTSGNTGKSITISGVHFPANSDISIYYDANKVQAVVASSTGSFSSTSFSVPASVQGPHSVRVTDDYTFVSTTYTVKPKITESENSGSPGDYVSISGTGFAGSQSFVVNFNNKQVAIGNTDQYGSFTTNYSVPWEGVNSQRVNYTVQAVDSSGNSASVKFSYSTSP